MTLKEAATFFIFSLTLSNKAEGSNLISSLSQTDCLIDSVTISECVHVVSDDVAPKEKVIIDRGLSVWFS